MLEQWTAAEKERGRESERRLTKARNDGPLKAETLGVCCWACTWAWAVRLEIGRLGEEDIEIGFNFSSQNEERSSLDCYRGGGRSGTRRVADEGASNIFDLQKKDGGERKCKYEDRASFVRRN